MRFGARVERWRSLVEHQAAGIPVDLVLGIISLESGGAPGAIGRRKTKCSLIPSASGLRRACNALGLMQVVPHNVTSWNAKHPDQAATWELMTGKTTAAVRTQIKLGIYILRRSLSWLERYGFTWPGGNLSDEQIKIGLMVYAWGPGNMKPYLDELQATGRPITAAEIGARWPGLGKPANQPVTYSRIAWKRSFGLGPVKQKTPTDGSGWGILAIVVMAAFAASRKR